MKGLLTICRKELADQFGKSRFILLYALILMISVVIASMVGTGLKEELSGIAKPTFVFLLLFTSPGKFFSLIQFIAIFGPLLGIILGFDAINRERSARTLSKLVSQPIYRDAIINGKFLAGLVTITVMLLSIVLLISGLGLILVGVVPGPEEILRLALYFVISIFYISFWLGLSILFSVFFRSMATSALAAMAFWIFLSFFLPLGSGVLADVIVPVNMNSASLDPETVIRHETVRNSLSLLSPISLYTEGTTTVLDPLRKTTSSVMLMGPMEQLSISRFQNPLPLAQSLLIVLPQLISLLAVTCICFALSYVAFMRQEVRST
ncbi:MAG: ABC-2 family transporter protein [Syntrophaceae bacterium PtaU1.Bin231]|nr:MAG: ABC-2 family transporter protein [Syntrophaceae bacterium PtaU1.Bin231]HOG15868.1 ABC transporter permease subunit [Syntrophales bacterium]